MPNARAQRSASVIIPTYGKSRYLDLTLASYLNQTATDYEIVVVDDGSRDDTAAVVERYRDRLPLTFVRQSNRGRSAARNTAVRAATGDVVIFSDDDRLVPPRFVEAHLEAFAGDAGLVQGWQRGVLTRWRPGLPGSGEHERLGTLLARRPDLVPPGRAGEEIALVTPEDVEHRFGTVVENLGLREPWWEDHCVPVLESFPDPSLFRLGWMIGTTGNMSASREQLHRVGLFDEGFRGWGLEDAELCYRLFQDGARLAVSRDAVNHHQVHPVSKRKFLEWGANFEHFRRKFDSLEVILFRLVAQGRIGILEADAIAAESQALLDEGRPLLVRELTRRYTEIAAQGPVTDRLAAAR